MKLTPKQRRELRKKIKEVIPDTHCSSCDGYRCPRDIIPDQEDKINLDQMMSSVLLFLEGVEPN
jgi:hypothetical protein